MVSKCLTKYVIRDRAEMASGTETNTETEAQTAKATSAEASQVLLRFDTCLHREKMFYF